MNLGMRRVGWAQTAVRRLWWGTREVGLSRTLAGSARLVSLTVRKPARAEVVTAVSGFRIAFKYPAQVMPLLIVFQELLDPELAMLCRLLGPGRVAVDVGASIGTWTLPAAKTGAVVHACEPDAENLVLLRENVLSNGFASSVTTHDCALGAEEGWSSVSRGERRYLTTVRLATEATGATTGKRIYSLAQFARGVGITRIDVLKINTAGCEADVLAGGLELFQQQSVGVAILLDGLAVRPLLDSLKQFSYELGFYDGRKQKFIPVDASSRLDDARPGPMNRYVVVKHSSVTI
jgi:FkbM family methyltransferase